MKKLLLISPIVIIGLLINYSFVSSSLKADDYEVKSKHIKEKNKKLSYYINVFYPQIDSFKSETVQKEFNEYVKYIVRKDVDLFKSEMNDWDGRTEMESAYEMGYEVYYRSDDLISIRFDGYKYYSGAAHPLTFYYSVNYDLKNNGVIALTDIFKDEYLIQLSAICVNDLIRQQSEYLDTPDSTWILQGAGPEQDNFRVFNFTKTYFVITFPVYQVASYAEGPKEVIVNYGNLLRYIKTDGPLGSLVNE